MKVFWMVHCFNGGPARFRHVSEESAVNEAKRLARSNAGQQFCVLRLVDCYESAVMPVSQVAVEEEPVNESSVPLDASLMEALALDVQDFDHVCVGEEPF